MQSSTSRAASVDCSPHVPGKKGYTLRELLEKCHTLLLQLGGDVAQPGPGGSQRAASIQCRHDEAPLPSIRPASQLPSVIPQHDWGKMTHAWHVVHV